MVLFYNIVVSYVDNNYAIKYKKQLIATFFAFSWAMFLGKDKIPDQNFLSNKISFIEIAYIDSLLGIPLNIIHKNI